MRSLRLSGTEWRLGLLLLAVGAAQTWLVRDMRFLASGLFGGDHVYQLACIRSIAASLNPMAPCNVSGALPGYFPLYGTLVAYFARITAQDPLQAMFVTAVIFRVLSAFVIYRVFRRLWGRSTGLTAACLWTALHPELIFKYTEFTTGLVVPLYFLTLHRYLEKPEAGRAMALGLSLTVLGYSHSVAFIGGVVIAGLAIVTSGAAQGLARAGLAGLGAEALRAVRHLPIFVGAGALTLGYWYRPIFVHHGRTSLHYAAWTSVDLSTLERRLAFAGRALAAEFSFESGPALALTLLLAASLAVLVASQERARFAPTAILASASFAWMFHYFATMPLAGAHFIPIYVQWMLWGVARVFMAAIPMAWGFGTAPGRRHAGGIETLALALALVAVGVEARAVHDSPDMRAAREPRDPAIDALTEYAARNLRPDDVALTTNELSFAWSAMTGRRTVVTRRSQHDAFMDMDVRNRDAALMLYGHDDTLRTRLLDRYDVRYLFWASNWFASEYQVTPSGDTASFDPFFYFRNDEHDEALRRAGIEFTHVYGWVDPALRGDDYPRFDLSVVTPHNYAFAWRPWRDDLDRRLEPVWAYPDANRPQLALFRVRRTLPARGR